VIGAKHPLPSRQNSFIRRFGSGEISTVAQNVCEPVARSERGRVFLSKDPSLSGKDRVVGILGSG
jgi:hypothetical protein